MEMGDAVQLIHDEETVEIGVEINGIQYFFDEEFRVEIQLADLKGFNIGSIPSHVTFFPLEDRTMVIGGELSSSPTHSGIAYMNISDYRKYWYHKYGMSSYYNALKEAITLRERKEEDVKFSDMDDDGAWIHFNYEIYSAEDIPIDEALTKFQQIESELHGQAERLLQKEEISPEVLGDEKKFTLEVVLPLLRKMDFVDVKYNHGTREYGKDVTFSENNKFVIRKNYAIQLKAGNISGKAGGEIDIIIGQIDDAFSMPYYDTSSRESRYISELLIIISGRFTDNAKEKIIEKVRQRNVSFLDIDKIEELLSKYMGIEIV
ncbi:MAG: restriction endonuclease [Candidatus Bathyarchaeota archaeon]|nr:restriction endonuclease [Candidatus Bathyarchaeota archaeon]